MSKGQTLQDPFLNSLRKERIPVSIFLVNGIKLQGNVESFDLYVILLRNTAFSCSVCSVLCNQKKTRGSYTPGQYNTAIKFLQVLQ